jgi:hypothetical protein
MGRRVQRSWRAGKREGLPSTGACLRHGQTECHNTRLTPTLPPDAYPLLSMKAVEPPSVA